MSFIHTPQGCVHLRKSGRGSRLMIAFHGYGEDAGSFDFPGDVLQNNITFYAVDLPFHGQTEWNAKYYTPDSLAFIVEAILTMENSKQFEALGFSLGGRLWLSLIPRFANRMTALYLLAPDGLGTSGMALVDWLPLPLRRMLGSLAHSPKALLSVASQLYRTGLLDNFSYRYFKHQMISEKRRACMLGTWYSLAHFPMRKNVLRSRLQKSSIPTLVLAGTSDEIVDATKLNEAFSGLDNVLFQEVAADHKSLVSEVVPFIKDGLVRYWKWLRVK